MSPIIDNAKASRRHEPSKVAGYTRFIYWWQHQQMFNLSADGGKRIDGIVSGAANEPTRGGRQDGGRW
jgi:hypothetical protein